MSLPRIQYPIFEIDVPSTGLKFKFRPFLVKEEKVLLTAQQAGDLKEMVLALKQVINNCLQDPGLDCDTLTLFDIEYMFLKLRSRSVNNVVEITTTDSEDGKDYKLSVNLEDVVMKHNPEHKPVVDCGDGLQIELRYPNVDLLDKIQDMQFDIDAFFQVVKYCIKLVKFEGKEYNIADYSEQEAQEFIQQLNVNAFNNITKFFDTMPKMYHEIKYKNSNDKEQTIVLETLADFFILR